MCVRMALAVGARSSSLEDLGRRRVERFGGERSGTSLHDYLVYTDAMTAKVSKPAAVAAAAGRRIRR